MTTARTQRPSSDEPAPDFISEDTPYEPGIGTIGYIAQLTEKPVRKKKHPIGFSLPKEKKTKAP